MRSPLAHGLAAALVALLLASACEAPKATQVWVSVSQKFNSMAAMLVIELLDEKGASLGRRVQIVEVDMGTLSQVPLGKPFSLVITAIDSSGLQVGQLRSGLMKAESNATLTVEEPLVPDPTLPEHGFVVDLNAWAAGGKNTSSLEVCLVRADTNEVLERRCASDDSGELKALRATASRFGGMNTVLDHELELRGFAQTDEGSFAFTSTRVTFKSTVPMRTAEGTLWVAATANPCRGTPAANVVIRGCQ